MKIYKVGARANGDEHQGYTFFTNKQEARKFWRENADLVGPQENDFRTTELSRFTKPEILAYLNRHASHPDNG